MSRWFRAYSETLNDPKVQTLPDASFKAWHNALYLAAQIDSKDGNIGSLQEISFAFRVTQDAVSSAFHPLIDLGLIETDDETFHIVSWKKRQYKSDTSTNRVREFRKRGKRSRNVSETAPDTDTDTELEKGISNDIPKKNEQTVPKKQTPAGTRLPENWEPCVELVEWALNETDLSGLQVRDQTARFKDYWFGKSGKDATKRDWDATWRNWIRRANDDRRNTNEKASKDRTGTTDLKRKLAEQHHQMFGGGSQNAGGS